MSRVRPAPRPLRAAPPAFVDTPAGIYSAGGIHYHTTEALLRAFAGRVLEHVPLETLVRAADAYAEAPRVAAAVGLLVGLVLLAPLGAVALAVAVWLLAAVVAPGLASLRLAPAIRGAASVGLQGIAFAIVLSLLAVNGHIDAVGVGLAGFFALRVGLADRLLRLVVAPVLALLYALPSADQTLRTLVVRAAIRHGVSLPATAAMERRVRAFWKR